MAVWLIIQSQVLTLSTWGRGSSFSHGAGRPCSGDSFCGQANPPTYKEVASDEWNLRGKRSWDGDRCKKPRRSLHLTVPQTDTGRQVEDTKAFEITIVKELGNLTP